VEDGLLELGIDLGALGVHIGTDVNEVSDLVKEGALDVEVEVVDNGNAVSGDTDVANNGKAKVGALDVGVDREAVSDLEVDGEVKAECVQSTAEDGGVSVRAVGGTLIGTLVAVRALV
jgi:hypothetical protein